MSVYVYSGPIFFLPTIQATPLGQGEGKAQGRHIVGTQGSLWISLNSGPGRLNPVSWAFQPQETMTLPPQEGLAQQS